MSGFLFDTNIPSETVKLRPEPRVTAWIKQQKNDTLYLSVVSIGELRRGFIPLPQGARRTRLEQWLEYDVMLWFDQRILPVTKEIADRWGVIDGTCRMRATPANTADGLIAATAFEHGLTVVTRNVRRPLPRPVQGRFKSHRVSTRNARIRGRSSIQGSQQKNRSGLKSRRRKWLSTNGGYNLLRLGRTRRIARAAGHKRVLRRKCSTRE